MWPTGGKGGVVGGRQSDTMIDWMKSNIGRKELMIEKTGVIGGLDLPEKAEHSRVSLEWYTHSCIPLQTML